MDTVRFVASQIAAPGVFKVSVINPNESEYFFQAVVTQICAVTLKNCCVCNERDRLRIKHKSNVKVAAAKLKPCKQRFLPSLLIGL